MLSAYIFKKVLFPFFSYSYSKFKVGIFLFIAIFLSLSLFSFDATDPSFNRASDNAPNNFFGYPGAYIADPILQFFGIAASLYVIAPIIWSLRLVYKEEIPHLSLRIISLFFASIVFACVISYFEAPESWPFYVGLGGYFGDYIKSIIVPIFTDYGFITLSLFLLSFLLWETFNIKMDETISFANLVSSKAIKFSKIISKLFIKLVNKTQQSLGWQISEFLESSDFDEEIEETIQAKEKKKSIVEFKAKPQESIKPEPKQESLNLEPGKFELPNLDYLTKAPRKKKDVVTESSLSQNAKLLEKVLEDFGVKGKIEKIRPGPVVTLYELEPSAGTKSSRVIGLADDIARSMSAVSARIAVIPGRNAIGIELPNSNREIVYLRSLVDSAEYKDDRVSLPMILGKDIGGDTMVADLARMPHLLVAGTTGSGKSVAINTMILSILYRLSPEECRFIMVDPKMLELSIYEGIPHLLAPVVTDPSKAVVALKWAVKEMENRYKLMSNLGVRNISGYNKRIEEAIRKGEKLERKVQTGFDPETGKPIIEKVPLEMEKLPFIVVIVDEMADLMLVAGKDIEGLIQRLAQMARAAGIHLIMATQRPSVDVITGVIKANFPTRISFQVTSKIDSRTILGEQGAEQLLGMGDMLYMGGGSRITRIHGPFVDDKEVLDIVNHLKSQAEPKYIEEVTTESDEGEGEEGGEASNTGDELYDKAVNIVLRDKKASTSYIQRQLKIGYNRAANIIEKMEEEGVISSANHVGKREVLIA